jgi:hypothetical protein
MEGKKLFFENKIWKKENSLFFFKKLFFLSKSWGLGANFSFVAFLFDL